MTGQGEASYTWSVVMFCRNESIRISRAIKSIETAFSGEDAHLTVILNGCSDDTPRTIEEDLASARIDSAAFTIVHGCKSNAINQFIFQLRPKAKYYLFVDAAAFIAPQVPALFKSAFERDSTLKAVSGVPLNGRSANSMRSAAADAPRLFGQMFALTASFLNQMIELKRRLPVDLYRGDGLLSGFICYETAGVAHETPVTQRVATVSDAGWNVKSLSVSSFSDIRTAFNRRIRQSRGRLENLAWNSVIWRHGFAALPDNANDMIRSWIAHNPLPPVGVVERFFRFVAIRRALAAKRPTDDALKPKLLSAMRNVTTSFNTKITDL